MALKPPSDFFQRNQTYKEFVASDVAPQVTESYAKFVDNFETVNEISRKTKIFENVESLSKRIEELSLELSEKLTRSDLENAMLSQLMILDENFQQLQDQVKGLNKKDLKEFKDAVYGLNELVDNLVQVELPKYKNRVTKSEIVLGEQVNQIKNLIDENIDDIRTKVDSRIVEFVNVVEQNFESIQQQIDESSDQVQKTTQVYTNLSKILENKILKENDKFEEYSNLIENISESFGDLSKVLKEEIEQISNYTEEQFKSHQQEVKEIQEQFESLVETRLYDYRQELVDVKSEVVINEQHIKRVDKYLQEYHQNLIEVKKEVFSEIESLPVGNLQENIQRLEKKIDFIRETYSKIKPEVVVKEVIRESNFTEPPETKNDDPLTPLNQNFVTLEQLQEHYRIFLNRIQQQLSTLGGGGETQLKYLDDVVGIATNPSAYDGKYLKYNHSIGKFEFVAVSGGPGGSQSLDQVLQIGNISTFGMNVGVVTATQFIGDLVGSATYATSSGIATALQNSRTFEITGDIIASPVIFDGTGNVSFAATIQPNSVSLGTDTTGNYVESISGAANEITVTGGTGEGSTAIISFASNPLLPGNVTIANDLQVNHNLNVTGNITIGGTSAYIISNDFRVKDADIVVGFATDSYGNDASNDTTANHGGIAVASTEGSPLVQLYNVAIGETNPATYKKIMWFKSGAFAGLNTDAWLINYAVGIGSTQFPSGTRLAAGAVQFTENDLAVVRNINASGIVTATNFVGDLTGTATTAVTSGYAITSGISTVSQGLTGTPNVVVGVVTATTVYGKIRENVISVSSNYSVQTINSVILATNNITITMPSAVGLSGDKYYIKNVGVGTVTIKPSGIELIDDYSEMKLESKNSSLTLISDNSKWLIF